MHLLSRLCLTACLLVRTTAPSLGVEPPKSLDVKAIDAYLARQVKTEGFVGLSAAVMKDGKIVLAKGYGKASVKTGAERRHKYDVWGRFHHQAVCLRLRSPAGRGGQTFRARQSREVLPRPCPSHRRHSLRLDDPRVGLSRLCSARFHASTDGQTHSSGQVDPGPRGWKTRLRAGKRAGRTAIPATSSWAESSKR